MGLFFPEALRSPLLPALIGLARAVDASALEPDDAMFRLLREGLSALTGRNFSGLLARILEEKQHLVPGCIACTSPCGRTADPTAAGLSNGAPEVLERKSRILYLLELSDSSLDNMLLLRAVFALGEDWTPTQLDSLIQELS